MNFGTTNSNLFIMRTKLKGFLMLFMALMMQITFAQERTVTGTVVDDSGLPLPGVSVAVKGTTSGTQTDFDGKFKIQASASDVLVFTYVGMTTQEVNASSTSLNVALASSATENIGCLTHLYHKCRHASEQMILGANTGKNAIYHG